MTAAMQSPSWWTVHSLTIPKLLKVGGDGGVQLRTFCLLLPQGRSQALHPLREGFVVLLRGFGAHVAAGRKHVAVLADVIERRRHAEPRHVGVRARLLVAAPGVVGARDLGDVLVGEFAVHTVYHRSKLTGIDEERCAAPVVEAAVFLAA